MQVSPGTGNDSYTNNFVDIPASQTVVTGVGETITKYVDVGAVTNALSLYYRIRLVRLNQKPSQWVFAVALLEITFVAFQFDNLTKLWQPAKV